MSISGGMSTIDVTRQNDEVRECMFIIKSYGGKLIQIMFCIYTCKWDVEDREEKSEHK